MTRKVMHFDPASGRHVAQFYDGDSLPAQTCRRCLRLLPAHAFPRPRRRNSRPGDRAGTCKQCRKGTVLAPAASEAEE